MADTEPTTVAAADPPPSPSLADSAKTATGGADDEVKKLTGIVKGSLVKETEAIETARRNQSGLSQHYLKQMEDARAQEHADMRSLKPFDTKQELAKHETNVWEAFGSPGFLVAMLGSAFTAMPMNSALMAGGAAINAINQKNQADFDKAFEAWQQNTELAIKRLNQEDREYQQIVQAANFGSKENEEQLRLALSKYEHTRAIALLDAGYSSEVYDLITKQADMTADLEKKKVEVIKQKGMRDEIEQRFSQWNKDNPDATEAQRSAERFRIITDVSHRMKEAETVHSFTMSQEVFRLAEKEMEKAKTAGETIDEGEAIKRAKASITPDTLPSMRVAAIKDIMKKSDVDEPTAEKIFNARKHEESLKDLERDEIKKIAGTKGISLAEAEREFNDDKKSKVGVLDEDAIRVATYRLFAGDQSAVQGLGWGNVGSTNRAAVQNMIPKIGREKGWSDEKIGRHLADAKAAFAGEMRGASTLGQREALLTAGIEAAASTIPRVIQTAKNINPTEFSDINRILQNAQSRTGNKDVVRFGLAMETMIIEYARSMGTSSQTTDTATTHARDVLQRYWSQGQLMAGVDQLMSELKSMHAGIISGRIKFIESFDYDPQKRSLDIPVYVQSEAESHTLPKGQLYVTPDLDAPMMRAE